jgi:copper homeostasis protein
MSTGKKFILEACVESLEEAVRAERAGADRLELCSALHTGGLFPDELLLKQVLREVSIPISVMIRARPGNFEYSENEISIMKEQINICRNFGVFGVVFGASKGTQLDYDRLNQLIEAAEGMSVTIHKVVDMIGDTKEHIEKLTEVSGIDRVLSSGGCQTAWEGRYAIKEMMNIAGDRFNIMPGGKVRATNVSELDDFLNAKEYHGRMIV